MADASSQVLIVGAGFSGTMVAANLARLNVTSRLVEAAPVAGPGRAYGTADPDHLLNVPAAGMSAWPGDPDAFQRYWHEHGDGSAPFAPRRLYGEYLRGILAEACASGRVRVAGGQAVSAAKAAGEWQVQVDGGHVLSARHLVLATGNEPSAAPGWAAELGDRFVADPWSRQAGAALAQLAGRRDDVLIIGTGLTMIDLALSLQAAGFAGRTIAVSRRGLLPRPHDAFAPAPVALADLPAGDLMALWRWIRHRSGTTGWRAAVDCLRPHTQTLWQALDDTAKRRFLRHARPHWDVRRHRIAPAVAGRLAEAIRAGRLEVQAGRIVDARREDRMVAVRIHRRGEAAAVEWRRYSRIFNCTGPLGSIRDTRDPLLSDLLGSGTIAADNLGIAISVDACARVRGHDDLWAVGPLSRGEFWEMTAVPDIRVQAAAVAERIASQLALG